MVRLGVNLVALVVLAIAGSVTSGLAADLTIHRHAVASHWHHHYYDGCRCGPPWAVTVYHRDLRETYGAGFDPRNYDQTEPHFYFGPVHRYVRYYPVWPYPWAYPY
jgi:hypothetical protein